MRQRNCLNFATMKPISRSFQLQVTFQRGLRRGARIFLPDIPELRNTLLTGIEVLDNTMVLQSQVEAPVPTTPELAGFALTLIHASDKRAVNFPLASMCPTVMSGLWKEFNSWRVNYQKSFLRLMNDGPVANGPRTVCLNVFYTPLP